MKHTPTPWYEAKTGNHQGLIISETSGANVAVTYDAKDAPVIVAAVNSHADLVAACQRLADWDQSHNDVGMLSEACSMARAALAKAGGASEPAPNYGAMRAELVKAGWTIGPRNPNAMTDYEGCYMALEPCDLTDYPATWRNGEDESPWCIVGNSLDELVLEAYGFHQCMTDDNGTKAKESTDA